MDNDLLSQLEKVIKNEFSPGQLRDYLLTEARYTCEQSTCPCDDLSSICFNLSSNLINLSCKISDVRSSNPVGKICNICGVNLNSVGPCPSCLNNPLKRTADK